MNIATTLTGNFGVLITNSSALVNNTVATSAAVNFSQSLGDFLQTGTRGSDGLAMAAPAPLAAATDAAPDDGTAPQSQQAVCGNYFVRLASSTDPADSGIWVGFSDIINETLYGDASDAPFESDKAFSTATTGASGTPQLPGSGSQHVALTAPTAGSGAGDQLTDLGSLALHFDNVADMETELPRLLASMQQQLGDTEAQVSAAGPVTGVKVCQTFSFLVTDCTYEPASQAADTSGGPCAAGTSASASTAACDSSGLETFGSSSNATADTPAPATAPQAPSPPPTVSASASAADNPAPCPTGADSCATPAPTAAPPAASPTQATADTPPSVPKDNDCDQPAASPSTASLQVVQAWSRASMTTDGGAFSTSLDVDVTALFENKAAADAAFLHAGLAMGDPRTLLADVEALFGGSPTA